MSKEIIIHARKEQTQIALVENRELVELYIENLENARTIGNIYLGRVRKIMPNIQACFVDIGQKQDAFLHFSDISDNLPDLLRYLGEEIQDISTSNIIVKPESVHAALGEAFDLGDDDMEVEVIGTAPEGATETAAAKKKKRKKKKKPQTLDAGIELETDTSPESPAPPKQHATPKPHSPKPQPPRTERPKPAPTPKKEELRTESSPSETENVGLNASIIEDIDASAKPQKRKRPPRKPRPRSYDEAEEQENALPNAGLEDEFVIPAFESLPGFALDNDGDEPPKPRPKRNNRRRQRPPAEDEHGSMSARDQEETSEPSLAGAAEEAGQDKPRTRRPRPKREPKNENRAENKAENPPSVDRGTEPSIGFAAEAGPETAPKALKDATLVHPARYLREGQRILVKISKEPISNKGSRVTTDISLAGRFLVLVPMANYVAVSKKIGSQKERKRLRVLAESLLPKGFGVIVRTVAEERDAKSLDTDLRLLLDKWKRIEENIKKRANPPTVIYQDVSMVSSVIRDLFTEDYDRILVDDPKMHRNIRSYVQAVAPQMVPVVQLYGDPTPIYKYTQIENQIEEAYSSRVNMTSGGYLFIEHTEAMHVVDVNSGRAGHGLSQEENSLAVNLDAAKLIAKHLRLRDLGGIIVVDFIDMRLDSNRRKLYQTLRREFRKDRAVTKILPMSDFGLVEITRQRLRPSYTLSLVKQPQPNVTQFNPSVAEVLDQIETWLTIYKSKTNGTQIILRLHPFMAAYLKQGLVSLPLKWRFKHKVQVKLETDERVDPMRVQFIDPKSEEDLTEAYLY